jgi:hypothetical protein
MRILNLYTPLKAPYYGAGICDKGINSSFIITREFEYFWVIDIE